MRGDRARPSRRSKWSTRARERWTARIPPAPDRAATAAARRMQEAARAAGKSEVLDRLAADYPRGPHDQPQSMCPAFGSLRVGLRMRRTATILCGSACCVYGLTFTSHFYGARRTRRLRAVQLRDAGPRPAVRGHPRRRVRDRQARRLRRGRGDQPLRADRLRRAARPAAASRSTACASSASTCRASACRRMPRRRTCWPAPCCASPARRPSRARSPGPRTGRRPADRRPDRRAVPGRPAGRRRAAGADGPGAWRRRLPSREWRDLYAALDCAVAAAVHPFYTATHPRVRTPPGARSSAPGRSASRAPRPGSTPSARPPAWRPADRRGQGARRCRRSAPRSTPTRSRRASPCPATRARSCWSPGC